MKLLLILLILVSMPLLAMEKPAQQEIEPAMVQADAGYLTTSDGKTVFTVKIPEKPWKKIDFPFATDHPVRCTQGNASPSDRTHFYINTLYAVDLASLPGDSAGIIYAAFGGKALIEDGCFHGQSNDANACSCNQGFGNNVRILQENGTYALYAHLSSIDVKHGQAVIAGQRIGVEGSSGAAGHRHLHFSVHKVDNPQELEMYQTPGLCIPFIWNIQYKNSSGYQMVSSLDLKVSDTPFYGAIKAI